MIWQLNLALGALFIALGVVSLVVAQLLKRGTVKPGNLWGRSAGEAFWQGIGYSAWGLGMLSRLVLPEEAASVLYIIGAVVFIITLLIARKKAAHI